MNINEFYFYNFKWWNQNGEWNDIKKSENQMRNQYHFDLNVISYFFQISSYLIFYFFFKLNFVIEFEIWIKMGTRFFVNFLFFEARFHINFELVMDLYKWSHCNSDLWMVLICSSFQYERVVLIFECEVLFILLISCIFICMLK